MSRTGPTQQNLTVQDLVLRAKLHYARGKLSAAERDLRAATARAPDHATAHLALACVLARQRKTDPAVDALVRALEHGFADRAKIERSNDLAYLLGHGRVRAALARLG